MSSPWGGWIVIVVESMVFIAVPLIREGQTLVSAEESAPQVVLLFENALEAEGLVDLLTDEGVDLDVDDARRPILLALSVPGTASPTRPWATRRSRPKRSTVFSRRVLRWGELKPLACAHSPSGVEVRTGLAQGRTPHGPKTRSSVGARSKCRTRTYLLPSISIQSLSRKDWKSVRTGASPRFRRSSRCGGRYRREGWSGSREGHGRATRRPAKVRTVAEPIGQGTASDASGEAPPSKTAAADQERTLLERGRAFSQRILLAGDAVLKTFAAVAVFAVGKFGADRLGAGDYAGWRWLWALLAVAGFAVGVALALNNLFSAYRGSRVSHGWLLSDKGKEVRDLLNQTPYLYGGATNAGDLQEKLTTLMMDQYSDPVEFLTSPLKQRQRKQLQMLLLARRQTLDEALAENTKRGTFMVGMGVGATLAAVSASCFVYTTNQATRRAELALHARDRKETIEDRAAADVVAGSLLPKTPAQVRIKVPANADASRIQEQLSVAGTSCDLATVQGVLIAIASPPIDDKAAVMRVVTLATSGCHADELWLRPEWVVSAEEEGGSEEPSTTTSTTTPSAGKSEGE